jgi:hypothetical protein
MNPARHGLVPLPREQAGPGFEDAMRARAEARAFLVGMQRAALHAADEALAGGPRLQAMRVIMVLPGAAAPRPAPPERQRMPLQVLPGAHPAPGLRALGGEVLRDAYGRLYERGVAGLRALGSVVAGADGRLYERLDEVLEPFAGPGREDRDDGQDDVVDLSPHEAAPAVREREFAQRRLEPEDESAEDDPPAASPARGRPASPAMNRRASRIPRTAPRAAAGESTGAACPVRALLPAPGKWVQLRYGEFAALLRPQLAAPERMGPDYEIGAYLQVFDSARAIDSEEAARWVFGDARPALAFGLWNTDVAQRLGVHLGSHDGRRGAVPDPQAAGFGAGQRFFALRVVSDPTAGMGDAPGRGAPEAAARPAGSDDAPRRSVPPALLCAVAPTRTREQAIAVMQQPPAAAWWRRLLPGSRVSRAARRDWQLRLAGRNLDEQLWAVAPPPHALGDAALREWAQRTLRLAGYDLPRMVDEWEIFWRCRGATD